MFIFKPNFAAEEFKDRREQILFRKRSRYNVKTKGGKEELIKEK